MQRGALFRITASVSLQRVLRDFVVRLFGMIL